MISLQVENYCQNCPDFEPYCNRLYSLQSVETLVQCAHKDLCKEIKAYIEGQMARKERPDYMATCANRWEDAKDGE
jgi:hypothetical protein